MGLGIDLDMILFGYLALVMVVSSGLAVLSKNPVYTILLVLVMVVHQAFLLLTLGSEFLMAVQLIVYAGAVLVLFLFIVYLINLKKETKQSIFIRRFSLCCLVFLVFAGFMIANLYLIYGAQKFKQGALPFNPLEKDNLWWIAHYLFNYYLLPFEIIGVILLVAVLGAVFLVRKVKTTEEA
ncbi:hypothetical protein F1847_00800 [Thermodesulfobacterium sp. TA1]|uniref:NADH-quinone oxidoreductase subunit J family protein n=1 Tax=Thermodesulfobacterium sp. TA1 TaxID=2234087 RepID=UPI0012321B5C|nr:NADH-quinone oxidoreductase subunit J [Thermodesulfobacterium sp. TA1]QER41346.1 hypothetical protein F1847_00800 [Thermodesulfobacterium sp. TA1]